MVMEELQEIKNMWAEINNRLIHLEEENRRLARKAINEKYKNAQERLISKYRTFIIIEVIMIIYVYLFIFYNPMVGEKYKLLTTIYWIIFFIGETAFDSYLMYRVQEIDIYGSSVREITRKAALNWKIHKIGIAIGFPLAIGAVVLFALAMDANEFVYMGMTVGFIVGLVIGLRQLYKFMKYYKLLQSPEE